MKQRVKIIKKILKDFSGSNGEPDNEKEKYTLESMWVMLCAEFEGSVKELAEHYIDSIKRSKRVKDMHVSLLLQNFYGSREEELTVNKIINLFKRNKKDITYENFTRNKTTINKSFSVENLFNSLGIYFKPKEIIQLKLLDGIASTRDSIAHGDILISITRKQLEQNIVIVGRVFKMLKAKLK